MCYKTYRCVALTLTNHDRGFAKLDFDFKALYGVKKSILGPQNALRFQAYFEAPELLFVKSDKNVIFLP